MNIFQKIAKKFEAPVTTLGNPSKDEGERQRRIAFMAQVNPSGFRTPKKKEGRSSRGNQQRAANASLRNLMKTGKLKY